MRCVVCLVFAGSSPESDGNKVSETNEQPPKAIAAAIMAAQLDSRLM
jgi:hypothetical protein